MQEALAVTGKGVAGTVAGTRVAVGNAAMMAMEGANVEALEQSASNRRGDGATLMFVSVDKRAAAALAVADQVKPSTPAAIPALHR